MLPSARQFEPWAFGRRRCRKCSSRLISDSARRSGQFGCKVSVPKDSGTTARIEPRARAAALDGGLGILQVGRM